MGQTLFTWWAFRATPLQFKAHRNTTKNGKWQGQLIVSNTIFSYDPNETAQQVSQLLSKSLGLEAQIQCSQVDHIENPASKLRVQEQEQQREAFIARVENSPFVAELNHKMSVSLHLETTI